MPVYLSGLDVSGSALRFLAVRLRDHNTVVVSAPDGGA